jgi:hypothetical protein
MAHVDSTAPPQTEFESPVQRLYDKMSGEVQYTESNVIMIVANSIFVRKAFAVQLCC